MISLTEIANRIKQARLTRNYSQDYLGRRLGISQNAYSKIELGRTEVNLTRLSLIADVLEVDLFELIKGQGLVPMRLASKSA